MAVTGKVNNVSQVVINKLKKISTRLGKDVLVVDGVRPGSVDDSSHCSGIAADIKVEGMATVALCDELKKKVSQALVNTIAQQVQSISLLTVILEALLDQRKVGFTQKGAEKKLQPFGGGKAHQLVVFIIAEEGSLLLFSAD